MTKKILTVLFLFAYVTLFAQDAKLSPDSLYHHDKGEKIHLKSEVDSLPKYQPSDNDLFLYLAQNLKYPSDAKEKEIQGKVYVSFIVETNGSISDIIVIKSLSESCDNEAKRLVSGLPNKWTAALKSGQPVRFQYILPFSFTLTGSKSKKRK